MISNPNFIYYACIAKGTTILAQHRSKEQQIEELAAKCIAQAPLHHSMFSHTVKKRTYKFLIDEPFLYFVIFDEKLVKSEARWFLDHMKGSLDEMLKSKSVTGSDEFAPLCFQAQFDPIFRESMASDSEMENPLPGETKDDRNASAESIEGKRSVMEPLIGQPNKNLKKKKRLSTESNGMDGKDPAMENKLDVCDEINGGTRDVALSVPKGAVNDRQRAKQIWKKQVWVVLSLDLFVCAMLFVIWLWVCRGFECMRN